MNRCFDAGAPRLHSHGGPWERGWKYFLLFIVLLSFLIVVSGCSSGISLKGPILPAEDDWTQFGGTPSRTSFSSGEQLVPPLEIAWKASADGPLTAGSLLGIGGYLVTCTFNGTIKFRHIISGEERGSITARTNISAAPAVMQNRFLLIPWFGKSSTIEQVNLSEQLSISTHESGFIEVPLLVVDNHLIAVTSDGIISRRTPPDMAGDWKTKLPKTVYAAPAFSDSLIYSGCADGDVHALNFNTGTTRWKYPTGSAIFTSPVISHNKVIVANHHGTVTALDATTGTLLWKVEANAPVYGTPSTDGEKVYVPCSKGTLYALSLSDGSTQWKYETKCLLNTTPFVNGTTLVLTAQDRSIRILNKHSGAELWKYTLPGLSSVSPIVYRAHLVVSTGEGEVFVFRSAEGKH